jgi:hypothetical protein
MSAELGHSAEPIISRPLQSSKEPVSLTDINRMPNISEHEPSLNKPLIAPIFARY